MFSLCLKLPFDGRNELTWNVLIGKQKWKIYVFSLRMRFGLNIIGMNFKWYRGTDIF
jgi:hypothetical protein